MTPVSLWSGGGLQSYLGVLVLCRGCDFRAGAVLPIFSVRGTPFPLLSVCQSIPARYLCPITVDIFEEPVMDQQGHNFEKWAIESWLLDHDTCPLGRYCRLVHSLPGHPCQG